MIGLEGDPMKSVDEKKVRYQEFLNRELGKRHHTDTEDSYQYELMKAGNLRAVEESKKIFASNLPGHVSDDPVRNYKYLFVASCTLASRAAISGGMEAERAYNISDLFILKMDHLTTVEEVLSLHAEMIEFYTREMAALAKQNVFSKPITICIDYIYNHLHEHIGVETLSSVANLNKSYLSTLFKKETGVSISDYILSKRLEAAKNMLKFSDISYSEISSILTFSSQSHFTRVFKTHTGFTPKEYRNTYFSTRDE